MAFDFINVETSFPQTPNDKRMVSDKAFLLRHTETFRNNILHAQITLTSILTPRITNTLVFGDSVGL